MRLCTQIIIKGSSRFRSSCTPWWLTSWPTDMGFGTTRTTQLKSVGDGVQIVALLIAGTIILNVRNSRLLVASGANITCVVAACCLAYISREHT